MKQQENYHVIKLGLVEVLRETGSIRGEKGETKISPRSMDVLLYLIENTGRVVSAEELLNRFWSSLASDHAVHKAIAELRAAMGDSVRLQRHIKTVPKRGYKLLVAAEVSTEVEKLPASTEEKAQRAAYAGWRWGAVCAGLMVALTGLWTLTQKRSEPAVVIDMAPLCFDSMDADGSGYLVIVSLLQTAGGVVEYPARFDLRQDEVLSAVDAPLCDIAGALGTNLDSTGG